MAKCFLGIGRVMRRPRYTITLFSTTDEAVAHGELEETGCGDLTLRNKGEMDVTCTGSISHAVIRVDGEARWIMPWSMMNMVPRSVCIGETVTFCGIKESESST